MKYLIILFSFVTNYCAGQKLSEVQLNRLSDACKLWGHVKYFHPYLQYKAIPWDSAFVAAVPEIIASASKQDYEKSLSKWLAVLNDPVTKVISHKPLPTLPSIVNPSPIMELKNSVLIVTIRNLKDLEDYSATRLRVKKFSLLDSARYIVFDLRVDKGSVENEWALESFFDDHQIDYKIGDGLSKPSLRTVAHEGFKQEEGALRFYDTYFRVNNGEILNNGKTDKSTVRKIPVVFLINGAASLPHIALAFQEAGNAIIISEGKLNENFSETTLRYQISDSLYIQMRKGELVSQKGLLNIHPDFEYAIEKDPSINLLKAISLLTAGLSSPKETTSPANAGLSRKESYPEEKYPSLGYRVLGAAKIYTVINTFFPNKELMDRNWDSVFQVSLPRFVAAKNVEEYGLAVAEMYANIQDGHGFIEGGVNLTGKFFGTYVPPFLARFIEDKYVVTRIINDSVAKQSGIKVGDIIHSINGKDPMQILDEIRKYDPTSNKSTQTARFSNLPLVTKTDSLPSVLDMEDENGKRKTVMIFGQKINSTIYSSKNKLLISERPIFKLLSPDIGYVEMKRLELNMVDSMFDTFRNTKGFIMDMRGYPKGTAWDIGPRLTERNYVETALDSWVNATGPLLVSESGEVKGVVRYSCFSRLPSTTKWRYKGKTVMLMNNATQSQAEASGLIFKAANGTLFIGSQTAGANGDVTEFDIPGKINLTFSGMNISYPNGQTMQRIGLIPDVLVLPTIKGIREGRDEVLEKAIEVLQKQ